MRVLGILFGAALVVLGIGWDIKLSWIDHPEATNRLLVINHWDQLLGILGLIVFGGFIAYISAKDD